MNSLGTCTASILRYQVIIVPLEVNLTSYFAAASADTACRYGHGKVVKFANDIRHRCTLSGAIRADRLVSPRRLHQAEERTIASDAVGVRCRDIWADDCAQHPD